MKKEGKDYIRFKKPDSDSWTKIDINKAEKNYEFWKERFGITEDPGKRYPETFKKVNSLFGNHTFPYMIYDEKTKTFQHPIEDLIENIDNDDMGIQSSYFRGVEGSFMSTATTLGLDRFVFSYLGVHDPYHRSRDSPPVMPVGFYINAVDFARAHGNPWDRDFNSNGQVVKSELEYYFLTDADIKNIITWRIENEEIFKEDFWRYFGTEEYWDEEGYLDGHWKNKAELCFYKVVPMKYIQAILWPVWQEYAVGGRFESNEFEDLSRELKEKYKQTFEREIDIIYYRPYGVEAMTEETWNSANLSDFEINLVRASEQVQRYYNKYNCFPEFVF